MSASLVEYLLARIAEDEDAASPRTVVRSGGWPAPDVLNCIGANGKACTDAWALPGRVGLEPNGPHWWEAAEVRVAVREHERTHVSREQARALREYSVKRSIVELCRADHDDSIASGGGVTELATEVLVMMASAYAHHPDFDPAWR